jgi:hypothetical protein
MTQARQHPDPTQPENPPPPAPAIHGVRARESFQGDITPFDPDAIAAAQEEASTQPLSTTDPWGVEDPTAYCKPETAPQEPALPRRGGGILTIPLLCVGIAIIACVTLLPLADENHQLSWEREKLRADLTQLKEQGRVNTEFLQRVADDPTLAERLAQRQMKYIREGSSILKLRGSGKEEMSPFHLVSVPPPPPLPAYEPVGGALATLVRQPRAQLYLCGLALMLIAAGLVLGYVPKPTRDEEIEQGA